MSGYMELLVHFPFRPLANVKYFRHVSELCRTGAGDGTSSAHL